MSIVRSRLEKTHIQRVYSCGTSFTTGKIVLWEKEQTMSSRLAEFKNISQVDLIIFVCLFCFLLCVAYIRLELVKMTTNGSYFCNMFMKTPLHNFSECICCILLSAQFCQLHKVPFYERASL